MSADSGVSGRCAEGASLLPSAMEKLRDWFGTPVAAGKTLLWLCWVSILFAAVGGLLYLLAWGVLAIFT